MSASMHWTALRIARMLFRGASESGRQLEWERMADNARAAEMDTTREGATDVEIDDAHRDLGLAIAIMRAMESLDPKVG